MTEDNFEKFLEQTARGYNTPPARVPREEMWTAIQAARNAGPRVVYGGGMTSDAVSPRRFGTRVWLGAAAAAMLLVATGVGIGRWTASPVPQTAATLPVNGVVVEGERAPDANASIDGDGSATANPGRDAVAPEGGEPAAPRITAPAGRDLITANGTRIATTRGSSTVAPNANGSASAYQLTAVRHLSEAEALLTSFRARTTADQQMDAQLGVWARQLLSNTRLLLDSPVANDPQRRPLLQDLELILVQIVQLSPGAAPQDRDLIEKTLQQEHVLTRLRTAIPAGPQRGS